VCLGLNKIKVREKAQIKYTRRHARRCVIGEYIRAARRRRGASLHLQKRAPQRLSARWRCKRKWTRTTTFNYRTERSAINLHFEKRKSTCEIGAAPIVTKARRGAPELIKANGVSCAEPIGTTDTMFDHYPDAYTYSWPVHSCAGVVIGPIATGPISAKAGVTGPMAAFPG
jgi:hypothetical protein